MRFLYGGREEIAVPLSSWPQEHCQTRPGSVSAHRAGGEGG